MELARLCSAAFLLLLFSLLLLLLRLLPKLKLHLPPRPCSSFPLLGDFLHLRHLFTNPSSLQCLHDKLGPIFTLSLGSCNPIIFIASADLAHEALVEKGRLFAGRPTPPSRALFTNNFRSIASATYGLYWRTMRRNLVQEMLSVPKILLFKATRARVLNNLLVRICVEAQQNEGMIVSIYANLRTALLEILLFMCFGFDMPEDAILEMSALLEEVMNWMTVNGSVADFYPFLRFFERKRQRNGHALRAKQVRIFVSHIQTHKELDKLGKLAGDSYLETLLRMHAAGMPFSGEDLVTNCSEFLIAGVDNTVKTLEWAMAELVLNPQIQSKLYSDIYGVVGSRIVEETDLPHLPYLQGIIKETMRLHPTIQALPPHVVSESCKIGGYDIPSKSIVVFNVASISKDPEIWLEPLMFKPERFLVIDVDITGTKEVKMLPFGAGRRICPGLGLAALHTELFLARMVQAFEWSLHPSEDTIDLSENPGYIMVGMTHRLRAMAKKRCSGMVMQI